MERVSGEQVRQFRLRAHHLDKWYQKKDLEETAGACGFQNSPPGAWENALYNRIPAFDLTDMKQILEVQKILLQAWSFRGAPVVFPASDSNVFLSALISVKDEPWIYTQGLQLALDFLDLPFSDLLTLLQEVIPGLDRQVLKSKTTLDQVLAEWITPLLSREKRKLWSKPSLYGNPEKQTMGGAVVSFLLRPCAYMGLVVFGKREGSSPTFTSYKNWMGHALETRGNPEKELMRKYLRCFAPASVTGFAGWLGCSPAQAGRIWQTAAEMLEPVDLNGKICYVHRDDKELLLAPTQAQRKIHLLAGHDPYLGLQDREIILDNKMRQKQIWQNISNPGAVLCQGKIAGLWRFRKNGKQAEAAITLWDKESILKTESEQLCSAYASFRQLNLSKLSFLSE